MKRKYTKTYHIIFDAFGVNRKLLNDEELVLKLLLEIPKLVNMKILAGPNLVRDHKTGNTGLTGFVIISFSHISIHTFSDSKECFVDIFSCIKFDYEKVRNYLYRKLKVKKSNVETLEVKYPCEQN